nr:MAG TPA_asm: hypothetical protein [Caudoviricetes sp.]
MPSVDTLTILPLIYKSSLFGSMVYYFIITIILSLMFKIKCSISVLLQYYLRNTYY